MLLAGPAAEEEEDDDDVDDCDDDDIVNAIGDDRGAVLPLPITLPPIVGMRDVN